MCKEAFLTLLTFAVCAEAQTFSTLYTFGGGDPAALPNALVIGPGGVLYGTSYGGNSVFAMAPPAAPGGGWTETILSSLTGAEGVRPLDAVAIGAGGVLYATAFVGGSPDGGTVFSSTPATGAVSLLHTFTRGTGGGLNPAASVVIGSGGVLYGTADGGVYKNGVVFSLTPPPSPGGPWIETILHSFKGGSDGSSPGALAIDAKGNLFGTTYYGGASNFGTVYFLTPPPGGSRPGVSWEEKIIYNFAGAPTDGADPIAGVTIGSGGILYGTTVAGGPTSDPSCPGASNGCGTVFSLSPPASPGSEWTEAVLYSFTVPSGPETPVAIGSGGVLYGATCCGGPASAGTLFSLTPPSPGQTGPWTATVLHEFNSATDGFIPEGIVIGKDGVLYGATGGGGAFNNGTIFALKP